MAWQLATERERVFFILNTRIQYTRVCLQTRVISKMLAETNILQLGTWQKINWVNIIKIESILPLNQKFTVFFCQIEPKRFNNPILMEQTQPNDNFFSTQSKHGPSKHATWKRVTKHRTFPWRKLKITKCERRMIETSVNSSFVRESVFYHLERFVSDNYNRRYNFLDKVFGTLQTINILASDLPTHGKTQNFSSKKK